MCHGCVSLHVWYTFPDHNNLFLAVIDPVDGRVVVASYPRDWIGGSVHLRLTAWSDPKSGVAQSPRDRFLAPRVSGRRGYLGEPFGAGA